MNRWHVFAFLVLMLVLTAAQPGRAQEFEKSENSAHFKIYYHAGYERQAGSLLAAHENAYPFVTEFIGYAPPSKTKIYLCSTPTEWKTVGNAPHTPPEGSSAGQWSRGPEPYGWALSYYNPDPFGGTAVHEFVHAVEGQFLQFERPRWWVEGLAVYLTYKFQGRPGPGGISSDMASEFSNSILYNNPQFKTLEELEGEVVLTQFGYTVSASVFLFIEESYGASKVKEIIQAADTTENVHLAFQTALGISFQEFQSRWENRLVESVRAISVARSAVGTAEREGRTQGLNDAKGKLSEATNSFNLGRFAAAGAKANEAKGLAETATVPVGAPTGINMVLLGVLIVLVIAATAIFVMSKRR